MHEVSEKNVFLKEETPTPSESQAAPVVPFPARRKTLGLRPGPKRMSHEEAMEATFTQYGEALRVLAGLPPSEETETKA